MVSNDVTNTNKFDLVIFFLEKTNKNIITITIFTTYEFMSIIIYYIILKKLRFFSKNYLNKNNNRKN